MRLRTGLVVIGLFILLAVLIVFGFGLAQSGGTLDEQWVSDTARENQLNHHAVGAGPNGEVIVAPVAELAHSGVTLTNTSCALVRLGPENGSILWEDGIPAASCDTHALTEPAIEDIDDDGELEVIFGSGENALVVTDARTGNEEFRLPLTSYGFSRPTVADIKPTEGTEIVTSDIHGNVVVAYANGTVAWRTSLNETFDNRVTVRKAPVVDDVDADGSAEIAFGTRAGPAILSSDGEVEWSGRNGATHMAVAQADEDPAREIFTASLGNLQAVDGASHELQWQLSVDEIVQLRTASDADGDGTVELYVGLSNGTIMAINAETGTREWATTVSTADNAVIASPILAEVDDQENPVVVAGSRDGVLVVLDAGSGAELAAYERRVPIRTFPTAADIDGDNSDETLVRYGDGRVVALDYEVT